MTQSLPPKSLVLYAEDDPDDIELVIEAFRKYVQNVELLTFADGVALLHFVENLDTLQGAPCLFIIDINMPRLNGKDTLRELRKIKKFADVPAVLFSTSTLPADGRFAAQFNAGFITKSLHAGQIHLIVDQIIEHCGDEVKNRIRKKEGH